MKMEAHHNNNGLSTMEDKAGPSSNERCNNSSLDDAVGKLLQGMRFSIIPTPRSDQLLAGYRRRDVQIKVTNNKECTRFAFRTHGALCETDGRSETVAFTSLIALPLGFWLD
ncbi:hypothetical protein HN011_004456 [Eciton burchellii]|nr:hypothetical protein HN011_004456 [Eciton burchellii]